ncbi:hypothetical protein GB995_07660 [Lactobacillus plantarum]|uniref:hypothetical protein n=1 Tax=Lactiplantibacillus plantarum TaxID=1590 RepID=UPI00136A30A4|nr:hypothetical protein [Lactiplantibacillus plantarum]MYU99202.1 hypothetical protein [Lactiplantibacillus plantarum]
MNKEKRMVQTVGVVEFLKKTFEALGAFCVVCWLISFGGFISLVTNNNWSLMDSYRIMALILEAFFLFLLVIYLLIKKVWLPYLKRRIAKDIFNETEKQILTDNEGHSLEITRLKKGSVWRSLVYPYKEARLFERDMGLPVATIGSDSKERKLTRAEGLKMRNQDLKDRYELEEKQGLGYAAPFYLRCYGSPKIAKIAQIVDEPDDVVAVEHRTEVEKHQH